MLAFDQLAVSLSEQFGRPVVALPGVDEKLLGPSTVINLGDCRQLRHADIVAAYDAAIAAAEHDLSRRRRGRTP